ncbi:MAG: hypothetical protein ACK4FN_00335 [Acinetobacter johnsonii]
MDIQKEREAFEAWLKSLNENGRTTYFLGQESTVAWEAWQAAKAQAVPEGFVVVAKELPEKIAEKMAIDRIDKPTHENDPVWSEIAEESYKNQVKLKKWEFWRDYKAMIEAQEQK